MTKHWVPAGELLRALRNEEPRSAEMRQPRRRRFFTRMMRRWLYLEAEGYCQECGIELERSWHADHVVADAAGGPTSVDNGQSLCPECNLRKGASKGGAFHMNVLREWQEDFLAEFKDKRRIQRDFLLNVTPAGGKTFAALKAGEIMLNDGTVERIVVVVPTAGLKEQWGKKAQPFFGLNYAWSGDAPESRSYKGLVVTYQSLPTQAGVHQLLCSRKKTMVILDEIHHLGDQNAWAEGGKIAFGGAAFRLGLTGTPFRSDNVQIPWVRYELNKAGLLESRADFTYGYGQAYRDLVVRRVNFPRNEGEFRWLGRAGEMEATFEDELPDAQDRERFWAAIDPDEEYMQKIMRQADKKLSDCRATGHRNAGGLILCSDTIAAERYRRAMERICGEKPDLVVSNHEEATSIQHFKESDKRWLVAIRMVSEGVDIERLAVLVYATDVKTALFFRQAVGRVTRMQEGVKHQQAFVYIPDHKMLREFAKQMEEEIAHVIHEEEEDGEGGGGGGGGAEHPFEVLSTQAKDSDTISLGATFSSAEIQHARNIKERAGVTVFHDEDIAAILRAAGEKAPPTDPHGPVQTVTEREKALRRRCHKLVNLLALRTGEEPEEIHRGWIISGGTNQNRASIEELERKRDWLVRRIEETAPMFGPGISEDDGDDEEQMEAEAGAD